MGYVMDFLTKTIKRFKYWELCGYFLQYKNKSSIFIAVNKNRDDPYVRSLMTYLFHNSFNIKYPFCKIDGGGGLGVQIFSNYKSVETHMFHLLSDESKKILRKKMKEDGKHIH